MASKKYKAPRAAADPAVPKVSKPRIPKPRTPGLTTAEWKADVHRRQVVTGERAKRGEAKKKRHAAAAEEQASRAIMVNDRHQPRPPHASQYAQGVWVASQQSVASPASFSPAVWTYSSSPDYAADDALAPPAFAIDPHSPPPFGPGPPRGPAFTADVNSPYRYSSAYSSSPNLRRGALPFGPGSSSTPQFSATDAEINDMIATGSAAAASEGFYVDSRDPGAETEYTEQEDAAEEVEEVDAPDPSVAGKRKKRAPTAQKPTEPRPKWTPKEDECLAESWKTVSVEPITDANQNFDNYWQRVKTAFEERKLVDPEFARLHTDRGEKAMANYWSVIQQTCNKWHGIQEEVVARPESGTNIERQMVQMFEMYRGDNVQAEFKLLNVFTRIESCEKWIECHQDLAKNKEVVYNPNASVAGAAEGRPIGNKKTKAARDMAPAAERLQSSIDQCIADAKSQAVVREEKSEARWTAQMKKQDAKLDLLGTNVAVKKRNNDLAFLMRADTTAMYPFVRTWFMAERAIILNQMPAQAATDEDPAATEDPATDTVSTTGSASPTADDLVDASPSPTATADDLAV
ncbi:unnamed protein product [Alopecurus aequalis]